MRSPLKRHDLVARMRGNLEHYSFPRLQMLLLVSLTGLAGFLASYTLLQLGMGLRYLAAFGFAYTVFLILLWVWLEYADGCARSAYHWPCYGAR